MQVDCGKFVRQVQNALLYIRPSVFVCPTSQVSRAYHSMYTEQQWTFTCWLCLWCSCPFGTDSRSACCPFMQLICKRHLARHHSLALESATGRAIRFHPLACTMILFVILGLACIGCCCCCCMLLSRQSECGFSCIAFHFLKSSCRRVTASTHDSLGAKALSLRNPSPPGPKPAPGIVTT